MSHPSNPTSNALTQLEPFDDPEPGSTWFVSLAGVIVLIALIVAISALNFNTERDEHRVKVLDAGAAAAALVPAGPLDGQSVRAVQESLAALHNEGGISRADYSKLTQGVLLNAWMRYPWEDSKGQTQQRIRIPISAAMAIVADEYARKAPARPVASGDREPAAVAPTAVAPAKSTSEQRATP